jgi:uncharacterized protein (UPF0332 family)
MIFNWSEYLDLANSISRIGKESCYRSAISRAYYAAFCLARNLALDRGAVVNRDASSHQVVADYYIDMGTDLGNKIGANLERLRVSRNRADYDNEIVRPDSACQKSLEEAKQVLELMSKI